MLVTCHVRDTAELTDAAANDHVKVIQVSASRNICQSACSARALPMENDIKQQVKIESREEFMLLSVPLDLNRAILLSLHLIW